MEEDATAVVKAHITELLRALRRDLPRLEKIDRYIRGEHDYPWIPPQASDEYRLLIERSVTNVLPLIANVAVQGMYVDSFRPGREVPEDEDGNEMPEWVHWQNSRLDSRQMAVHRGAITFGHSFAVTERNEAGVVSTRGLSPLRTTVAYEDPASDIDPVAALHVLQWNSGTGQDAKPGRGILWTNINRYEFEFGTPSGKQYVKITASAPHGNSVNPVTRFAATVDLEGRTTGVVEPLIPNQDRLNQTTFDLLLAQSYSSIKVRWATGLQPPLKLDDEGEVVRDETGQPIPLEVNLNASRFLVAESSDVRYGTLDETPLDGFLEAGKQTFEQISALSQTPPHYLMGQIANLSAEALKSAEASLGRKLSEFRQAFGESWERVFQLAAELNGDHDALADFSGEVVWRDVDLSSLSQVADGLGKLQAQLGIPHRGLWSRVPNVTQNELESWHRMAKEDDPLLSLSDAMTRSQQALGDPANAPRLSEQD